MMNLSSILESILFAAGSGVEIAEIKGKLDISDKDMDEAIAQLKQKYDNQSGINLLVYNNKLQFATNPKYADELSAVLSPIRERELTKVMLETLAIISYKQPITRAEIEEVRGVDCTYAIQVLSKMSLIEVVGRKDAIGKPLLFGTTDEFLKKFNLSQLVDLPNYETLLSRIQTLNSPTVDLYNSNRDLTFEPDTNNEVPDFLQNEKYEKID